jgi:hypothetical protein
VSPAVRDEIVLENLSEEGGNGFKKWFFRVYCGRVFTNETQHG